MNFKQYIKLQEQNTIGKHNDFATAAFLPSDWTGSETYDLNLPFLSSIDVEIPSVTKTSVITSVIKNKNPIIIELRDGTRLYLDIDQYRRINKTPEVGQTMTVVFQRNKNDFSDNTSKIIKIQIN